MKQQLIAGFTATLMVATGGLLSSSKANQSQTNDLTSLTSLNSLVSLKIASADSSKLTQQSNSQTLATTADVVKVGERQSQQTPLPAAIANIQAHQLSGRSAVTVYLKKIPVLTFLGPKPTASSGVKVASSSASSSASSTTALNDVTTDAIQGPVWQATAMSAKLNQMHRDGFDARTLNVKWEAKSKTYQIKAGKTLLLALNEQTVLPNSTRDPAQDALQITNLLRRQLGNAPALTSIIGQPKPKPVDSQTMAFGPVRFQIAGLASWYGPGFHGALTANGERFNQYAYTAAHRSLPFGTQVRVTNLNNGRSVVVRINDRGPFTGGRVLDLSQGAAQVIGVIGSGVAPVRMDILR
jgi:rare lipoprotein A